MGKSLRLLIVEDSENDALLAINELELAGFDVQWTRAGSMEEIAEALESSAWDLVIAKHSMPGFDSLDALKVVTDRGADNTVIVFPGPMGEKATVSVMKAGARDCLMKEDLARLPEVVERELQEAEIRRSQKRSWKTANDAYRHLLSLFDSLNQIVYISDPATYEVLYANPHLKSLIGSDPVGGLCYEEVQQFDIPCDLCPMDRLANAQDGGIAWEYHNWHLNSDYVAADRLIKWVDGRDVKLHIAFDVTARKQAERELAGSERRNRALIEESPIGIAIVQGDDCVYANPTLLKILGNKAREDISGHSVFDVLLPEHRDSARALCKAILAGQHRGGSHHCRGYRKGGEEFDMEVWPRLITLSGDPALLLFVADTTETQRLWNQLVRAQKMEALGTLAGGVAHDFNNLLTIVTGYCELILSEQGLPDHVRGDLETVIQAGRSGAELVQRLLAFSRNVDAKPRPVNLNLQVTNLKKLLIRTIPKMIDIELRLADRLAMVYADPTHIDQVLMNLAVNAKDAMPNGGTLTITTENAHIDTQSFWMHPEVKPGDYVLVTVTDTGVGMDRETLEHIFEPFFSTKGAGKGTGLGLAMVYGIVQQHNGYVSCSTQLGSGTSFEVYLPVMEESALEVDGSEHEATILKGTETLLLVDDEEPVRDLGCRILASAGYVVLTAVDARDALAIYHERHEEIALVILDLVMPGMGGKDCLDGLFVINPSAKVLIATGLPAEDQTKQSLESVAAGFVTKPFQINHLLKSVRAALGSAQETSHTITQPEQ